MKRVLVCVLDWGLGHATRSVPVIRELQSQGADVLIASSGPAGELLKQEFPELSYHELPGYRPEYPRSGSMILAMARQLPRFRRVIRQEHKEVETLVKGLGVNVVLSDNRFGCYSSHVPSVFVTHQVRIRLPGRWKFLEAMVNAWQRQYMSCYTSVWVPDVPGVELTAHFMSSSVPVIYLGWLSRFGQSGPSSQRRSVVAMVSGPEPQRSVFAERLRGQLAASGEKSLLVLGLPGEMDRRVEGNLEIVNHLPAGELEAALRSADLVIGRSGYSTIMDMIALGRKAAFVPTPQQPEQIHLARMLNETGIAFCQDQENFTVETLRQGAARSKGMGVFAMNDTLLKSAVQKLLA